METKIKELTHQQEELMAEVADRYEKYVLSGDDTYDENAIIKGIKFLYEISELKLPEIVICTSPLDMVNLAGLKKGETFDYLGCGYDSGWTAFYDYMQQIGVEFDKEWNFDVWKEFITKSGIFATVLCENVAFVCIRPNRVKLNADGNLHCENGPAIAWVDGYEEYFLNGVSVDEALVKTPFDKLDPKMILTEKNAEVRREIVRKIGIERICEKLGAKIIDANGEYELLGLDIGDGRVRPYLKMKNPSIETYHIEGVHPDCKTVSDALTWRNGTSEKPIILT